MGDVGNELLGILTCNYLDIFHLEMELDVEGAEMYCDEEMVRDVIDDDMDQD